MGEQAELTVGNAISYGEGEIEEERELRYLPSTGWPEGELAVLENRYNVTRSTAKKRNLPWSWPTFEDFLAFVNERAPAGYLPSTWRISTDLEAGLGYTPGTVTLKPGPKARALAMGGESTRKRKKKPEASDETSPVQGNNISNDSNIKVTNMATVQFPLKDGAAEWISYWAVCKAAEVEANEARRNAEETLCALYAEEFQAVLDTLGETSLSKSASIGGDLNVALEKEIKVDQAGALEFLAEYPVYAGLVLRPKYEAIAKGVFSIVSGGGAAAEALGKAIEVKVKGSRGILFSAPK